MDERLRILFERRSIRVYSDQEISREEERSLLEAGMAAPSGSDRQPWRFITVRDRAHLEALSAAHPYGKMLAGAGLGIIVCGDPAISEWWVQDCSACTENILVAAAALGLGAVWIGCHGRPEREQAVRDCLGVPEAIGILCVISVGHPGEKKQPRTQYDGQKLHSERW
ncbi:MAG TPA: nitroreductase family protein [Spirochaetia bacterium]|nr:nitroreductase family protein [Spirochaetia bacterium]